MSVNFSQLPEKIAVPDQRPSVLFWTVVFLVLTLAGVATILLLWPKGMPTQTWKFWITLLAFPTGLATLVVLHRYGMYQGKVLDAEIYNEVCEDYTEEVVGFASRPLAVIGSAYRFSEEDSINALALTGIQDQSLSLPVFSSTNSGSAPLKARQFVTAEQSLLLAERPAALNVPDQKPDDEDELARQQAALGWAFAQLQESLVESVRLLPQSLPVTVQLKVASKVLPAAVKEIWQNAWEKHRLRSVQLALLSEEDDSSLKLLDTWLDRAHHKDQQQARLIVTVQLHTSVAGAPPRDSAEAGTALLMLPAGVAQHYQLTPSVWLHRPQRGALDQTDHAMVHALKWADVTGAEIGSVWHADCSSEQCDALRDHTSALGLKTLAGSIDTAVGLTGVVAPWLAICCAVAAAQSDSQPQMVLLGLPGTNGQMDCAVVRPSQAVEESEFSGVDA